MNLKKTLKCLTIGVALGMMSPGHVCGAPEGQAAEGVPSIFHKGARVLFQGDSITDGQRDKRGTYPGLLLGQGYPFLIAANFCGHYIDLNPLRAGMVKDPKDYRWSGYGEAMGGGTAARSGLCGVVGHEDRGAKAWGTPATAKGMSAAEVYRCWLFEDGRERSDVSSGNARKQKRAGIGSAEAAAEKQRQGKLGRAALLRCRVRYFTDGLVLGSKSYVDGVFTHYRNHFGPRRTSGARALREDAQASLFSARQLTVRTVG